MISWLWNLTKAVQEKKPYEFNIPKFNKGKKIIRHVTSWLWNLTEAKYKKIHLSS